MLTIVERPAANADPDLQTRFLFLEGREATEERPGVLVHRHDVEVDGVEENKSKVEMGQAVEVQVLGCDLVTGTRVRPRLVIADVATLDAVAVLLADRSLGGSAASKLLLATTLDIAKVVG